MKYKFVSVDDPILDSFPKDHSYNSYAALVEFDDLGNPSRVVAFDGGEPEDQTFWRDFGWIEGEMNSLAKTIETLQETIKRLNSDNDYLRDEIRDKEDTRNCEGYWY